MRLKGFSAFQHAEAHLTRQTTHGAIGEQHPFCMRRWGCGPVPSAASLLHLLPVVYHTAVAVSSRCVPSSYQHLQGLDGGIDCCRYGVHLLQ
jgi:hypothetical protein